MKASRENDRIRLCHALEVEQKVRRFAVTPRKYCKYLKNVVGAIL